MIALPTSRNRKLVCIAALVAMFLAVFNPLLVASELGAIVFTWATFVIWSVFFDEFAPGLMGFVFQLRYSVVAAVVAIALSWPICDQLVPALHGRDMIGHVFFYWIAGACIGMVAGLITAAIESYQALSHRYGLAMSWRVIYRQPPS